MQHRGCNVGLVEQGMTASFFALEFLEVVGTGHGGSRRHSLPTPRHSTWRPVYTAAGYWVDSGARSGSLESSHLRLEVADPSLARGVTGLEVLLFLLGLS